MVSEGELVVLIRSDLWDKVVVKYTKKLLIQGQFFYKLKSPKGGRYVRSSTLFFMVKCNDMDFFQFRNKYSWYRKKMNAGMNIKGR